MYIGATLAIDFTLAFCGLVVLAGVSLPTLLLPGFLGGLLFVACIAANRGYRRSRIVRNATETVAVVRASGTWALLLIAALYLLDYSIPALDLLVVLVAVVLGAQVLRVAFRLALRWAGGRDGQLRNAVIVGDYSRAMQLQKHLTSMRGNDLNFLGVCSTYAGPIRELPILDKPEKTLNILSQVNAEVVIITGESMSAGELRRFIWSLEHYDVDLFVAPNLEDVSLTRLDLHSVAGTPLLGVSIGTSQATNIFKTMIDRTLGALLLLAVSIPLLLLCLAIRLSSPGPVFFSQERVGLNGKPFKMYKLRSMYIDAEERRARLLAQSDGNVVMFKMRDDPRVTPIGKLLRRFSADELPQLFNVLKGDMSLVGPRPPLPEEVQNYCTDAQRRLNVKPGLTGLWQVNGRSDLDWDDTVRYDLKYVDNVSIPMDLHILARTFQAVLGGRGAY